MKKHAGRASMEAATADTFRTFAPRVRIYLIAAAGSVASRFDRASNKEVVEGCHW